MKLEQGFPSVEDMRKVARRRMPRFARDYLDGGIGRNTALRRNLDVLNQISFTPRYLSQHADQTQCETQLFGQYYDAPFGVAPIGLGGLLWPRSAEYLAATASEHNLPFVLSGFSTSSLEDIAAVAGQQRWYQHAANW